MTAPSQNVAPLLNARRVTGQDKTVPPVALARSETGMPDSLDETPSVPRMRREAHPVLAASLALTILLLATYVLAGADRKPDAADAWFDISVYDFTSQDHPTAFEAQTWFWSIGYAVLGWHLLGVCYLIEDVSYADQDFMIAGKPTKPEKNGVVVVPCLHWYWPSALTAMGLWIVGFGLVVVHRSTLMPAVVVISVGSLFAWHHLLHVYRDGTVAPHAASYGLYIVSFAALAVWVETASGFLLGVAWARQSSSVLDPNSSATFIVWLAFKVSFLTAGVAALYASVELGAFYAAQFVVTLSSYLESAPAIGSRSPPSAKDVVGILLVLGVGFNVVAAIWSLWRRMSALPAGYLASFDNSVSGVVPHVLTWIKNAWSSPSTVDYRAPGGAAMGVRYASPAYGLQAPASGTSTARPMSAVLQRPSLGYRASSVAAAGLTIEQTKSR